MRLVPLFLVVALAIPATAVAARKAAAPPAAPAFRLPARTGVVDSDSLRGKVLLVDFWASWCGPCRHSFPWMSGMNEKYGARGLMIVAIDLDKKREDAEEFLRQYPAPFAVAFDPAGRTAEAFKVAAMPTTFLVSADGHILARHIGFDSAHAAAFETQIQEALPK